MKESRTQKLQQLLKRLGRAVQGSVVNSDEVSSCLHELRRDGWDAVMLLDASLVCRQDGSVETKDAAVHIHVDPVEHKVSYRIDARDAAMLRALGISPSRHRTPASPPMPDHDE